jgi:hypothetical protein
MYVAVAVGISVGVAVGAAGAGIQAVSVAMIMAEKRKQAILCMIFLLDFLKIGRGHPKIGCPESTQDRQVNADGRGILIRTLFTKL